MLFKYSKDPLQKLKSVIFGSATCTFKNMETLKRTFKLEISLSLEFSDKLYFSQKQLPENIARALYNN